MSLVGNTNGISKIPGIHFPSTISGGAGTGGLFGAITQSPYIASQITPNSSYGTSVPQPNPRPGVVSNPTLNSISSVSAGGGSSSSSDPFASYFSGDQALKQELDALNQQKAMLGTNYQTQAEQAAINYGSIPTGSTGYSDPSGLLAGAFADPNTITAAANNPYSVQAQLKQQLTKANNGADANLVARGMYRSGELGQDENLNTQSYDTAGNTALQQFLSALSGFTGDYNTGLGNISSQMSGDYNDATNRAIALINQGLLGASSSGSGGSSADSGGGNSSGGDSGGGGGAAPFGPNTPVYAPNPGAGQGDVGSGIAGLGGAAGGYYVPPQPPPPPSSGAGGSHASGGTNYQARRNSY